MDPRRKYTKEFKLSVVNELESGKPAVQIAKEQGIHTGVIFRWRRQARKYPQTAFSGNGNSYTLEAQLAEKDRLIGRLYAENELLKKAIASLRRMREELRGG